MLIFLFFLFSTLNSSQIYINEIVSDNDGIINDFEGKSSDWIELYNPNDFDVNLYDYSLTDNNTNPIKWTFPDINIKAKSFLVIFCSGKDTVVDEEVHTNFSISSEGEKLFLYDNNPDIVKRKKLDFIEIPALRENKAYGKLPDGDGKLSYLSTYSPGETNIYSDEIICNYESGFYKDSIIVELESTMGYEIRYTLDGSDPDENSPIYTKPIKLYNSSDKPNSYSQIPTTVLDIDIQFSRWEAPLGNVDKMHILRFISMKNKKKLSSTYYHSYYVGDSINFNRLPVFSIVLDSLDLFDANKGIYLPGNTLDTNSPFWTGNYYNIAEQEDKYAHLTMFDSNLKLKTSMNIYLNLHGSGSRRAPQKSLRIKLENLNGPDEIDLNLFNDTLKEFKRFNLKAAMGITSRSNIIQNEFARELSRNLNFEGLNYKPSIVFINGEYWGIHTITEHTSKHFFKNYHNEEIDSIQIVTQHYSEPNPDLNIEYQNLIKFVQGNDLSIEENYNYVKSKIDMDSYIEYNLFEIIIANKDWPFHNCKFWKDNSDSSKWRWIFFDADAGFYKYNIEYNMFEHLINPDEWYKLSTILFRELINNNNFNLKLKKVCERILNNNFDSTYYKEKYFLVRDQYKDEMLRHNFRWNYFNGFDENWQSWSDSYLLNFFEKRPTKVLEHLEDFMNLTSYDLDECYGNQCDDNGITIYPNPSIGKINIKSIDKYRNSNITIYNHVGKVVYNLNNLFVDESKQLDLTLLVNGVYFIKFENQFGQYTFERIVINR